jgi:hypothetical protein
LVKELSYTARSINGVLIRLLAERWSYTNACCDDVLSTIEGPDLILRGPRDTQIAVRRMSGGRYLLVTYREFSTHEGFVISARIESRVDERAVIWRAHSARIG